MDQKRKPNVLWAQVSDKVFLTLDLQEAEKPNVQLNNKEEHGRISFRCDLDSSGDMLASRPGLRDVTLRRSI